MTRAADFTRHELLEAATLAFAADGYEGASVRGIAAAANVNLAAISYHFGGKEGLYREVLKRAIDAFDLDGLDAATVAGMDRKDAVRLFLRSQLTTLLRHDEVSRSLRIFAWENLARTQVFREFVATERLPVMDVGAAIVSRFLPSADQETLITCVLWLVHQAEPFTRNRDRLNEAPIRLKVDKAFVARLTARLASLVQGGLEALEHEHLSDVDDGPELRKPVVAGPKSLKSD